MPWRSWPTPARSPDRLAPPRSAWRRHKQRARTRRLFLGGGATLLALARAGPLDHWHVAHLAVHHGQQERPVAGAGLPPEITPNDSFYVVSKNIADPDLDPGSWHLQVEGLVDRALDRRYLDVQADGGQHGSNAHVHLQRSRGQHNQQCALDRRSPRRSARQGGVQPGDGASALHIADDIPRPAAPGARPTPCRPSAGTASRCRPSTGSPFAC